MALDFVKVLSKGKVSLGIYCSIQANLWYKTVISYVPNINPKSKQAILQIMLMRELLHPVLVMEYLNVNAKSIKRNIKGPRVYLTKKISELK